MHQAKRQRPGQRLSRALAQARQQQTQAITVADHLQRQLRGRLFSLHHELKGLSQHPHRVSSLVENLNSRLRNYSFLRRDIGLS